MNQFDIWQDFWTGYRSDARSACSTQDSTTQRKTRANVCAVNGIRTHDLSVQGFKAYASYRAATGTGYCNSNIPSRCCAVTLFTFMDVRVTAACPHVALHTLTVSVHTQEATKLLQTSQYIALSVATLCHIFPLLNNFGVPSFSLPLLNVEFVTSLSRKWFQTHILLGFLY